MTFDDEPTEGSLNPVTSGGIYSYISNSTSGSSDFTTLSSVGPSSYLKLTGRGVKLTQPIRIHIALVGGDNSYHATVADFVLRPFEVAINTNFPQVCLFSMPIRRYKSMSRNASSNEITLNFEMGYVSMVSSWDSSAKAFTTYTTYNTTDSSSKWNTSQAVNFRTSAPSTITASMRYYLVYI